MVAKERTLIDHDGLSYIKLHPVSISKVGSQFIVLTETDEFEDVRDCKKSNGKPQM